MNTDAAITCTRWIIRGQVQGVGFRPFVYGLATELGVSGWVRNGPEGVEIQLQCTPDQQAVFRQRLFAHAPAAARIDGIDRRDDALLADAVERSFRILESIADPTSDMTTTVAPDMAVCADCVAELFDPNNRRYRHPFIHCVNCGPRYTISHRLPYDRAHTSMAKFTECALCRSDGAQPNGLRFHAQTNACHDCGPKLWLANHEGVELATDDPIAAALARLQAGEILAIKGIGGFHLVCDAHNEGAVARLRQRKARPYKPFAVMCANPASAAQWVTLTSADADILMSPQRPILLLPKRTLAGDPLATNIAPDLGCLGVMLPTTPIHYLLFHEACGRPQNSDWLTQPQVFTLIMTSGNVHGEPLIIDNHEALTELAQIADAFLLHDRDILARCDDSVMQSINPARTNIHSPSANPQKTYGLLRRARGYTPSAVATTLDGQGLAVGGYLNNTLAVLKGGKAYVSAHHGDLANRASCAAFDHSVQRWLNHLHAQPSWIACDLHPDFYSTQIAHRLAEELGVNVIPVQHHHAHIGAVMAEHQLTGPVLGLALDGFGLGDDGTAWGGELMRVDASQCSRLGHLHTLPLPGGDRAAREPWRIAVAALHQLGRSEDILQRFGQTSTTITTMLDQRLNCPSTSSAGRWFDAAAGLLGIATHNHYEGQAAMQLEYLADQYGAVEPDHHCYRLDGANLDFLPLLNKLADTTHPAYGAAVFHANFAAGLSAWTIQAARQSQLNRVVLGGGCFANRRLTNALREQLENQGLEVFQAQQFPPGDGGLSLGQLWVGAQT